MQTQKTNKIFAHFRSLFGDSPKCELDYKTDIDLLVAIVLSAQCTDRRVNMTTPALFARYKTVGDYAAASLPDIEKIIRPCGFYKTKSANIVKMARMVTDSHGGVIPADMDALVRLPGVGRKTASVFLAEFHGIPALAVDTHVARVSARLGLTRERDPMKIEKDLARRLDRANWRDYHLYMVLFGRYKCKALRPECAECGIKNFCEFIKKGVN
jgi:endonuclease-3